MRRRVRIVPYKAHSASVRKLSAATGVLRIRTNTRTRFRPRPTDVIVNWGSHTYPHTDWAVRGTAPIYVNPPAAVWRARNKAAAFAEFDKAGVPTLEWTVHPDIAEGWLRDGDSVVVRHTATGQAGAGIELITPDVQTHVPPAPLYTKYAKKRDEYRIHVWGDDLLDIQQKRKRRETDVDSRIRSYDNGWVFCREGVVCPEAVSKAAVAAVKALGLDFGAVDVGWNDHYRRAIVFEVNTAPGLEGATLEKYANKIKELVG